MNRLAAWQQARIIEKKKNIDPHTLYGDFEEMYEYKFSPPPPIAEKKDSVFESLQEKCINVIKVTSSTTPEIFIRSIIQAPGALAKDINGGEAFYRISNEVQWNVDEKYFQTTAVGRKNVPQTKNQLSRLRKVFTIYQWLLRYRTYFGIPTDWFYFLNGTSRNPPPPLLPEVAVDSVDTVVEHDWQPLEKRIHRHTFDQRAQHRFGKWIRWINKKYRRCRCLKCFVPPLIRHQKKNRCKSFILEELNLI